MKETMNREEDRLLREALGRREGEADSVQDELDDLLREAMERRAERVPALSDDFQERVMARLRPLAVSPQREEGYARRRGLRRLWPWVGNIAAAVVVGWFVFFGYDRLDGLNGPDEGTANDSALAQETAETPSYTDVSLAQEARVSQLPAPMRGGVRGGVGKGTAPTSSPAEPRVYPTPAPPLKGAGSRGRSSANTAEQTLHADMSAFHASLEEIERVALQEVNTAMCEALGQVYGATSPS